MSEGGPPAGCLVVGLVRAGEVEGHVEVFCQGGAGFPGFLRLRPGRYLPVEDPQIRPVTDPGQVVLQAPAPVIAKALGSHDRTATRPVTGAGGTWSRYAPGDHQR